MSYKAKIGSFLLPILMGTSSMSHADQPAIDLSKFKTAEDAQAAIDKIIPPGEMTLAQVKALFETSQFKCDIEQASDGLLFWTCAKGYPLDEFGHVNYFIDLVMSEKGHLAPTDKVKNAIVSRNVIYP